MKFQMFLLGAVMTVVLGVMGTTGSASAVCGFGPTPDYWSCDTDRGSEAATAPQAHTIPTPDYRWTKQDLQDTGKGSTVKSEGNSGVVDSTRKDMPPKG